MREISIGYTEEISLLDLRSIAQLPALEAGTDPRRDPQVLLVERLVAERRTHGFPVTDQALPDVVTLCIQLSIDCFHNGREVAHKGVRLTEGAQFSARGMHSKEHEVSGRHHTQCVRPASVGLENRE